MPLDIEILGKGVYSPREAARLIGSTPQEVMRWTRGSGPYEPLWNAYYQPLQDTTELNFADLIEIRIVRSFRKANISMQAIRFAIQFATEKFGISHPLTAIGFKTDGQEILMEAVEKDGEYVSLSKKRPGQKVFAEIIRQSLVDLEYEEDTVARWRPKAAKGIVIDPARYFGDPILDKFGVSTSILAKENSIFNDINYLSSIYEIPKKDISEALKFEKSLDSQNSAKNGQSII